MERKIIYLEYSLKIILKKERNDRSAERILASKTIIRESNIIEDKYKSNMSLYINANHFGK